LYVSEALLFGSENESFFIFLTLLLKPWHLTRLLVRFAAELKTPKGIENMAHEAHSLKTQKIVVYGQKPEPIATRRIH
jgi:hypothetical protein